MVSKPATEAGSAPVLAYLLAGRWEESAGVGDESTSRPERARSGQDPPETTGTPPPSPPDPPGHIEPAVPTGMSSPLSGARGPLLIVLVGLVTAVLGAALLVARHGVAGDVGTTDDVDPDAEAALDAVQAATRGASSFRFRFEGLDTMAEGVGCCETPGPFSGEGEWTTAGWRLVNRRDSGLGETILDGETMYVRRADEGDALDSERWENWGHWEGPIPRGEVLDEMSGMLELVEEEEGALDEGFVDWLAVALAAEVYLGDVGDRIDWVDLEAELTGFPDDPGGFLQAIQQSGTPTIVGETGETLTLGATVQAPADVVQAFGRPVPHGEVELDVGVDHLPTALRLAVHGADEAFTIDVQFTDWNLPIDISPPADDQIDEDTSSTTSTTLGSGSSELRVTEVNFDDLSQADDPVLRTLAGQEGDGDPSTGWHRSNDHAETEAEAQSVLGGVNAVVVRPLATWEHSSGSVAVQFDIDLDGRRSVATVLFTVG